MYIYGFTSERSFVSEIAVSFIDIKKISFPSSIYLLFYDFFLFYKFVVSITDILILASTNEIMSR